MANALANASDWYIDLLNRLHILPANVAAIARSVSAKQLGDKNFRPRPLTEKSFTKAELAAILRLSQNGEKAVTADTYDNFLGFGTGDFSQLKENNEKFEAEGPESRFSPLGVLRTSLGQFSRPKDKVIRDIYDFNRGKIKLFDLGNGKVMTRYSRPVKREDLNEDLLACYTRSKSNYGKMRNNIVRLAHTNSDPDEGKIHAVIPVDKIRKIVGDTSKYDILKKMTKKEMLLRGAAGGGALALPVGAALGATSGALSLLDKRKRKHWLRTLALSTLAGAGIVGLAGAGGGAYAAHRLHGYFSDGKKAAAAPEPKRKKRSRLQDFIYPAISLGVPALAATGLGLYGYKKLKDKLSILARDVDMTNEIDIQPVNSFKELYA